MQSSRLFYILLAAIAVVFGSSVLAQFIALDDSKHIWSNPYVSNFSKDNLTFFWKFPYYGLYIPVVYNFWSLLASLTQFFGLTDPNTVYSAYFFHGSNLFFHTLNSCMVLLLLDHWLRLRSQTEDIPLWPSLAGALLYALHPLQVEPVAWASGLKDVLSGFFALLTLLLYCYLASPKEDGGKAAKKRKTNTLLWLIQWPAFVQRNKKFLPLLLLGFFTLSLLCKPAAVTLPIFIAAMNFLLLRKSPKQLWNFIFVSLAISIFVILKTKSLQPDARLEFDSHLWQRPWTALHAIGFYISKTLLPLNLAPDYGLTPLKAWSQKNFWYLVALGVLPFLLFLFFRKSKVIVAALLLFLLGLGPVLGFVPFEFQNMSTVADRYLYLLPMLGLTLLFQELILKIPQPLQVKAIIVMSVLWGFLSFFQVRVWSDNNRLFSQTLKANPDSYLAYNNLGLMAMRAGDFKQAEEFLKKSLVIKPDYWSASSNLGAVYFKQKNFAQTIEHYTQSLKDQTNLGLGSPAVFADMYFNLGAAQLNTNQIAAGQISLEKSVLINPDHFAAHYNLGRVYGSTGNFQKAKEQFLQALRLSPQNSEVIKELQALKAKGF